MEVQAEQQSRENVASLSYRALALQVTCNAVNQLTSRDEVRKSMMETINRLSKQIRASINFIGKDTRLVVLPEYFLTGFPMGDTIEDWRGKACIEMDGAEYDALGNVAQENNIFLSGNTYELDPHFPEIYFQTSFLINPAGEVILRYRRLNSMFAPTPHDVWDKYLEIYGIEGVFPVAETEIGNISLVASEEILYPEIARAFAVRGAEILLHSSSEVASPKLTHKHIARLARSIENMCYVISSNSAGIVNTDIPIASTDAGSAIIDYNGQILVEAGSGESMVANAEIDVTALRRHRRRPGMGNYLSRQRFELYTPTYCENIFYPANSLKEKKATRNHFIQTQLDVITKLVEQGVIR
ncbi:nitrilase-related carbon-nitrogen hydrolase [Solibacillus sp. CAU 1738]|uniref:nitrilase-related carbon-nitrogen hydrolase n=1 Tax=Solibacillus sp. CAU 1738 TaxID=3140363 RepID=UPI0032610C1E